MFWVVNIPRTPHTNLSADVGDDTDSTVLEDERSAKCSQELRGGLYYIEIGKLSF
jgi:hypothetical protein